MSGSSTSRPRADGSRSRGEGRRRTRRTVDPCEPREEGAVRRPPIVTAPAPRAPFAVVGEFREGAKGTRLRAGTDLEPLPRPDGGAAPQRSIEGPSLRPGLPAETGLDDPHPEAEADPRDRPGAVGGFDAFGFQTPVVAMRTGARSICRAQGSIPPSRRTESANGSGSPSGSSGFSSAPSRWTPSGSSPGTRRASASTCRSGSSRCSSRAALPRPVQRRPIPGDRWVLPLPDTGRSSGGSGPRSPACRSSSRSSSSASSPRCSPAARATATGSPSSRGSSPSSRPAAGDPPPLPRRVAVARRRDDDRNRRGYPAVRSSFSSRWRSRPP